MASGKVRLDIDTSKWVAGVNTATKSIQRLDFASTILNKNLVGLSKSFTKNGIAVKRYSADLASSLLAYGKLQQRINTTDKVQTKYIVGVNRSRAGMTALGAVLNNTAAKLNRVKLAYAQTNQAITQQTQATQRNTVATKTANAAQGSLNGTFQRARGFVLAYLAALATGRLVEFADATQRIENRIRLALEPGQDFNELFGKVANAAMKSRQPLEATATAFFRIQQASKQLGITQEAALEATTLFNMLLTVQGVTMHEARSALLQYSQALQSGRFQGDEFRAISEILPQILDFLSDALGRSTKELRELARQGQITPRIMLQALFSNSEKIAAQFAKTNVTLTQGFNILMTQATITFSHIIKQQGTVDVIRNTFIALAAAVEFFLKTLGVAFSVLGPIMNNFKFIVAATLLIFQKMIALRIVRMFNNLRHAIAGASVAMATFNKITKKNILIFIISSFISLGILLQDYIKKLLSAGDAQIKLNEATKQYNVLLSFTGDALEAAGTEFGKWSMNSQQGAVAIGTSLTQHVLKGIDDVSAALGRALITGENFKEKFLSIFRLVGIAIVESVVQILVKMAITKLIDGIIKKVQDRKKEEERVEAVLKRQRLLLKDQKGFLNQIQQRKELKEIEKEGALKPNLKGLTSEAFDTEGLATTALMSAGVPAPLAGLGVEVGKELTPELKNIARELVGLGNITEGIGLKQINTLTQGFGGLSGLLGGSGIPGAGGILSGALKVGRGIAKRFGFADGGRPPVGVPSIVGEEGPELFVPDTPGTIVPNGAMGGSTIVIQKLEILPYANVDEALTSKPMNFWVGLTQDKILPALNTLGQAGNTTTLRQRESR